MFGFLIAAYVGGYFCAVLSLESCTDPEPIPHGTFTLLHGTTTYDSMVRYSCDEGYAMHGFDIRRCRANGSWTPLDINCTIKDCLHNVDAVLPVHAIVKFSNGTLYNSIATVECIEGYRVIGANNNDITTERIICTASGNWSEHIGCERKECGTPKSHDNSSSFWYHETLYGALVTVQCDEGYRINGLYNNESTEEIYCMSTGIWSQPYGCVKKGCTDPEPIPHGNFTLLNGTTMYESMVRYSCDEGYTMHGIDIIRCLANGSWTPLDINCTIKDCSDPKYALQLGRLFYNENITIHNGTLFLDKATVVCQIGYHLSSMGNDYVAETVQCQADGQWSSVLGCQPKDCSHPNDALQPGRLFYNENLTIFNGTLFSDTAIVTCQIGYHLNGSSDNADVAETIQCQAYGQWSSVSGCQRKDCGPFTTLNQPLRQAAITMHGPTLFGDVTTVTCNEGYRIKDLHINDGTSANVTCGVDGSWGNFSGCEPKDCLNPPVLQNGYPNATTATNNSTVIYSCIPGYNMFGKNTVKCLETGQWSELRVNCTVKDCGTPPELMNGGRTFLNTTINSSALYTCHSGYDFVGMSNIYCLETGTWSELNANCSIKDCGPPPLLMIGDRTYVRTTVNSSAVYTCNQGYNMYGINTIRCLETGSWSKLETNCALKDCHNPPVLQNGYPNITNTNTTYNSTVIYSCIPGYRMFGNNAVKCLETGQWSELHVNCTLKDCGPPPMLINDSRTFLNTTVNSSAVYICNPRYNMVGINNTHCLETGIWSELKANCSIKGCIDLNVPKHWDSIGPNIQHIKILANPNNAMVYCQPGYSAFLASQHIYVDHHQITCRDGSWKSHSACQEIDAVHLIG